MRRRNPRTSDCIEGIGALAGIRPFDSAKTVASQVKATIRTIVESAFAWASSSEILVDDALRQQWDGELAEMRARINGMRKLFTQTMAERLPGRDFSFIERQRGMFSYSGLTADQVDTLREKFSIYIVRDGRINVAGINPGNVGPLCDAVSSVLGTE